MELNKTLQKVIIAVLGVVFLAFVIIVYKGGQDETGPSIHTVEDEALCQLSDMKTAISKMKKNLTIEELYDRTFKPEFSDNIIDAMITFESSYFCGKDAEYRKVTVNEDGEIILSYIYAYNANKAADNGETNPAGGTTVEPDWYIGVLEYNYSTDDSTTKLYSSMSDYVYEGEYACRYLYGDSEEDKYLLFGYMQ